MFQTSVPAVRGRVRGCEVFTGMGRGAALDLDLALAARFFLLGAMTDSACLTGSRGRQCAVVEMLRVEV